MAIIVVLYGIWNYKGEVDLLVSVMVVARGPVVEFNSRVDNFCWQTPILMKLVSVDRALKELKNDILFVRLYLILL